MAHVAGVPGKQLRLNHNNCVKSVETRRGHTHNFRLNAEDKQLDILKSLYLFQADSP